MHEVIVEEVFEEALEPVRAVVVQTAPQRPPLPVVIEGFRHIIEDETVPVETRAQEVATFVRNLVVILDENMITLGYFLYHIRKEQFWLHIPGTHHSFEQWCIQGSEGLDPALVNAAIRKYRNWSDCILFGVPDDIMLNQPLSPIKGEALQHVITEHHTAVKELAREMQDPEDRKAKIEEYVESRREELIQIWQDSESALIEKKHEENGTLRPEHLYITDLSWDKEQSEVTFTVRLSIEDSEKMLSDLVAVFHNTTKSKFFTHVQQEGGRQDVGLLDIVREMIDELRSSRSDIPRDQMSEEEYYFEVDEDEDEDEE